MAVDVRQKIVKIAKKARNACAAMAGLNSEVKDRALNDMAEALIKEKDYILGANKKDIDCAKAQGLSGALIDRLLLNEKRVFSMAESLKQLTRLKDPVGELLKESVRPNGLKIKKVRVPLGVIAIIYESRPNVTADCIGLCLKSGNAVILRGGSEALNSNTAIFKVLKNAAEKNSIPDGAINIIPFIQRQAVDELLKLGEYIDLIIPRGGEGLIRRVIKKSSVPVMKHYKGICHVYVDSAANLDMASAIVFNAKVQRPGVCNAMETLLVHKDIAAGFLPGIISKLRGAGVEIRGDSCVCKIVRGLKKATTDDWKTEYLDLILSVRVVDSIEAAIGHINLYGSRHSDSIVTGNQENARHFLETVDSACVYVNASTRFTDGYEFGMGAEIGISTDKLHARGPVALEELTTYKYLIYGNGQVRT